MKKTVANTTIIVMCFSLGTRLIAFLFKVFLSRTMGAEALGLFGMGLAVFGLLTMIPSSGIPLTVSRRVAETADDRQAHRIVASGLVITLVVNGLTVGLFLMFRHPLMRLLSDPRAEQVLYIMLPATLSTCVYNVLRAYLMGRKHYVSYSVTETFEEIVNVAVVLVLMYGGYRVMTGGEALATAFLVGDVLTLGLLVILYVCLRGRLARPAPLAPIVKSSSPITLMRLFTSLAGTFSAILLPNRLVAAGMGVQEATVAYGEAVGMAYPLLFAPLAITSALSVVLLPELAQLSSGGHYARAAGKIDVGIHYVLLIGIYFFILFATLGRPLGMLIYHNEAAGAFVSFGAGMVIPLCLTQLTNTALNSLGLELKCFLNTMLGLVVMAVCLWCLPSAIGVWALAVAQTAFFLVSFAANLIVLASHGATHTAFVRPFLWNAAGGASIAALVEWIRRMTTGGKELASTILLGALASVLYAGLLLATRSINIHAILAILPHKKRAR